MLKIVINQCYGGYQLSEAAYKELGIPWDGYGFAYDDERYHPKLVAMVEKLGIEASGPFAALWVAEIPDGVTWEIRDHAGIESVHDSQFNSELS